MSTGHPKNFGYAICDRCGCERPADKLDALGRCTDWPACTGGEGWDANGAPTGVDANGDAT